MATSGVFWFDSFDGYTNSNDRYAINKTLGFANALTLAPSSAAARTGPQGLRYQMNSNQTLTNGVGFQTIGFSQNYSTVYTQIAVRAATPASYAGHAPRWLPLWSLSDSGTTQLSFWLTTTSQIAVFRGDLAGTSIDSINTGTAGFLGATTDVLLAGTHRGVSVKSTIHNTSGVLEIKFDDTLEFTLTGINTRASGNNQANAFNIGWMTTVTALDGQTSTWDIHFDDLVLSSTNYVGDVGLIEQYPTSNGTTNNWTAISGSNWQNVDDTPYNGDTDYNSSGTAGDIDLYNTATLTGASSIKFVGIAPVLRKVSGGARAYQGALRISGTNYFSGTDLPVPTAYGVLKEAIFEEDPSNPGNPITVSTYNSAEKGLKLTQ